MSILRDAGANNSDGLWFLGHRITCLAPAEPLDGFASRGAVTAENAVDKGQLDRGLDASNVPAVRSGLAANLVWAAAGIKWGSQCA
jgi:hypothetical protein